MSRKQLIGLIVMILVVVAFAAVIWRLNNVFGLLQNQTQEIVIALVMAIIAGFFIEFIYRKLSPQSKILKTTQTQCSDTSETVAKLILTNNNVIGRDHFKITMKDCSFFIQDLKTKNGTTVNGEELQGSQKYKLIDGDEIVVAKSLRIKYSN